MKELDLEELDKFDSVVFDLDGTLVNSMCFHIKAWQDVMKQYEIDVDYDWLYARGGVPSRYIAKELIEIHNLKDVDAYTLADKKADNYKSNIHKIIWARKPTTLEWWDESRLSFSTLRLYISLNSSGGDFTYATSKITI